MFYEPLSLLRFSSPDLCCLALVTGGCPRRQVTGQSVLEDEEDWWFVLEAAETERGRREGCCVRWFLGFRMSVVKPALFCRRSVCSFLSSPPFTVALRWEPQSSEWQTADGPWRSLVRISNHGVSLLACSGMTSDVISRSGFLVGVSLAVSREQRNGEFRLSLEPYPSSPVTLDPGDPAVDFTCTTSSVDSLVGGRWSGNVVWKIGWRVDFTVASSDLLLLCGLRRGHRYLAGQPVGSHPKYLLESPCVELIGKGKGTGALWAFPLMAKLFPFLAYADFSPWFCIVLSLKVLYGSGYCGIVSPIPRFASWQIGDHPGFGPSMTIFSLEKAQISVASIYWIMLYVGRRIFEGLWFGAECQKVKVNCFGWDPGGYYSVGIRSRWTRSMAGFIFSLLFLWLSLVVQTVKPDQLGLRIPAALVIRTNPFMELEACLRTELSQTIGIYVNALSDPRWSCGGCFFWRWFIVGLHAPVLGRLFASVVVYSLCIARLCMDTVFCRLIASRFMSRIVSLFPALHVHGVGPLYL